MHGSDDLRAGVSQSEMMYRALKELGRPVEYVRYPGAGHELSRNGNPRHRLDRLSRIIEFFERHVDNPRPAPAPSPPDGPADVPAAEAVPGR
ncbi:MAG: alpha/beta hydrolase family protein [Planctomycetota bacterium]